MKAKTIDDVIAQLEAIIDDCITTNNRAGYFASLYYKVTCKVKEGIQNGEFEDGNRMEMLDVLFANRYLEAFDAYKNNKNLSASWKVAFDSTNKKSVLLLQHLMLGINAHINLDLGISAIATTQSSTFTLQSLRKDFNNINLILNSLLFEVIRDINRVSPLLSILGFHASNSNSMLINFTIGAARDGAWAFAEDLLNASSPIEFIAARDTEISNLGKSLIATDGFFLWLSVKLIHLFEWKNPAKIVGVLRTKSKTKKFSQTEGYSAASNQGTKESAKTMGVVYQNEVL